MFVDGMDPETKEDFDDRLELKFGVHPDNSPKKKAQRAQIMQRMMEA